MVLLAPLPRSRLDRTARRRAAMYDGLALLVLVGGACWVWCAKVDGPAGTFDLSSSDLYSYFWSAYAFEARRLRDLALPFWNPYQGGGQPFLATLQPGALYPMRALLLVLDPPSAMRWSTLLHLCAIVSAGFGLCRLLGSSRAGAIAGATMLGMVLLPWIYWPSYLESATWLPVGAIALVKTSRDRRWRWPISTGIAAAMPVLAGGYQVTVYVGYALAIVAVALLVDGVGPPVGRASFLRRTVAAAIIGIGTAAPQLLPTLAWTGETLRQTTPLTDAQIQPFDMMTWRWLLYGITHRMFPMQTFFLSFPVVALAFAGFVTRGRLGMVLGAGALGAFLIALGPTTPYFVVYHWLPALSMFRLPERLFILSYFMMTLGLAFTVTWGAARIGRLGRVASRIVEVVCIGIVVWFLVVPYRNTSALPWVDPPSPDDAMRSLVATAKRDMPQARLSMAPIGGPQVLGVRLGMIGEALMLQDYEPLCSHRLLQYLYTSVAVAPPRPSEARREMFTGASPLGKPLKNAVLMDLVAVGGLLVGPMDPVPSRAPPFVRERTIGAVSLVRNPMALPRAYLVDAVEFVPSEAAALEAISRPSFTGQDVAVVVGVASSAMEEASVTAAHTPFVPAPIVTDEPERVVVPVEPNRPGLLVLADAFAPGWSVTVNGVPRALQQVNYFVRGVFVDHGDVTVEFRYAAPGFRLGVWIGFFTWFLVFAAVVVRRRARRSAECAPLATA